MSIEGTFDPHAIEQDLYAQWEQAGYFAPSGDGAAYSIAIPPPNVTDRLHLGHAFQHTLMDALIRYQRMSGSKTLWQTGTDHAQIATQMVVERQLLAQGITRDQLGRDGFIEKVWQWKASTGDNISQQIRRLGSSVDWSRERFTMDEGFSRAVIEVFVRLYEDGLIYRGKRLVNWDPQLQTSISDLEVENIEEQGHLWHIRYPLAEGARTRDGDDHVIVATTRPETMLGDTAVAVHPDDERYAGLVGAEAILPIVGRRLPIIADDYVDPAFGTGCLKITPAHDFNDYAVGERHGLEQVNVFAADASVNDNAPVAYRGLDRFEAREKVVADLKADGLLARTESHAMVVPRGDRSGAIVEPWLTDQWFVRIAPLAEPAIHAVETGTVEFVPRQYENVYFSWMRNIQDWCISRQQWWGHRIPAWYDADGNVVVARNESEARAKADLGDSAALRQDDDVLDTWFSSALWTFGTLGWPEKTADLAQFHPTNVLVTGYDIIFFWVARMIMMTLRFTGEVPFHKVYIHGMVRDADGVKMSKTRGNGLDPLDIVDGISLDGLIAKRTTAMTQPQMAAEIEARTRREYPDGIEAYGTDALRFAFCAMATRGRDLAFDLKRVAGYRNFCNKLWNAAKFVLLHTKEMDVGSGAPARSAADAWIHSCASRMIEKSHRALADYRFDLYANAVYEFAWHEYCDWYLELVKPVLFDDNAPAERRQAAKETLRTVLDVLLRAAHPIMPFITETIMKALSPASGTLMQQRFPKAETLPRDAGADLTIDWLRNVVTVIRNLRGEMNVSPAKEIDLLLQGGNAEDRHLLAETETLIRRLAKVANVRWLDDDEKAPPASVQVAGHLKVLVPMAGLIDVAQESKRVNKEIDKLLGELKRTEGKLGNANFVNKAPEAVVAKERTKLETLRGRLAVLSKQRDELEALDNASPD